MTTISSDFTSISTPKSDTVFNSVLIDNKLRLKWSNVTTSYENKDPSTKQVIQKQILKNVSGEARTGELLVIMGPSGAGKSSLLDCLAGRNTKYLGQITVNYEPWTQALAKQSSYILQEDMFYKTLTLREHLLFQAELRMDPKVYSKQARELRVDTVIKDLGLEKCQHSIIGDDQLRGLSGGERKRLSFASEILTKPAILFVDEPTSGLDSFMAEVVIEKLHQLAHSGMIVIATIHQPSSRSFYLFDKFLLLSTGSVVYHDKGEAAVQYFSQFGLHCPEYIAPTDYFMRQLAIDELNNASKERVQTLIDGWADHTQSLKLENAFTTTITTEKIANSSETSSTILHPEQRTSTIRQFRVLFYRNLVRLVRDRMLFRAKVFQRIFFAVLVGLIFLQLKLTENAIQNFSGVLFSFVMNELFSTAKAEFLSVPVELPLIIREYRGGLFKAITWYIAKNGSELPMQFVLPLVSLAPAYFMVGFANDVAQFFFFYAVLILVCSCATGFGYLIACISPRPMVAPILGIMFLLPFLMFGGLFINNDDLPVYLVWFQVLSPMKYAYEALMKRFWSHIGEVPCNGNDVHCVSRTGAQILQYYHLDPSTQWRDCVLLLVLNIVFRAAGVFILWLKIRNKSKQ